MAQETPLIWVLTDDRAGNVAQALGVAEALGRPFSIKDLRYNPLARLPAFFQGAGLMGVTPETRAQLAAPWPDLVIAAGRRTAPVARWIKKQSGGRCRLVQIMKPGHAIDDFDLVVVPNHDGPVTGANILRITGAPHRLTSERLAAAGLEWKPRFAHLPRPWIALLVGGATHSRVFPATSAAALGRQVVGMAAALRGSVLISTSRRTGETAAAAVLDMVPEPRYVFSWAGNSVGNLAGNPYLGYLALADLIVVTGDSISMCSEAAMTGKPLYIFAPEGLAGAKHQRFHAELYARGNAKPLNQFTAQSFGGCAPPLNATGDIARAVEHLLQTRGK